MRSTAPQLPMTDSSSLDHSPAQKRQNCRRFVDFMSCGKRLPKEKMLKITSEAGMLLKTNKTRTFCHPNRRTFYAKRHESSDILYPIDMNRRTFWYQMRANVASRRLIFSPRELSRSLTPLRPPIGQFVTHFTQMSRTASSFFTYELSRSLTPSRRPGGLRTFWRR